MMPLYLYRNQDGMGVVELIKKSAVHSCQHDETNENSKSLSSGETDNLIIKTVCFQNMENT